jgi:hypothetical protein
MVHAPSLRQTIASKTQSLSKEVKEENEPGYRRCTTTAIAEVNIQ